MFRLVSTMDCCIFCTNPQLTERCNAQRYETRPGSRPVWLFQTSSDLAVIIHCFWGGKQCNGDFSYHLQLVSVSLALWISCTTAKASFSLTRSIEKSLSFMLSKFCFQACQVPQIDLLTSCLKISNVIKHGLPKYIQKCQDFSLELIHSNSCK